MTEAERRVVEAAIRLVTRMRAWNWTWPLEATSLINVVDALADERARGLSRYRSGWAERMALGEDWHPDCRTWHRPDNCPEGQNPPAESAPEGRIGGSPG